MAENRKGGRLLWVDILKGLLILSVVIGHATGKYNRYIYQFHIAAFFMVSGYTANYSRESLFVFIYNRFVRLMLPFLSVFVFGVALSCFLMKTGTYHWLFPEDQIYIGVRSMIKELILRGNNYVWWMGACWYLSVLFGALCVQAVFHCGVKNDRWRAVGTFLTFFYALSVEWMGNISVFPVKLVLIAQGYLFVGEMARKHSIVDTIVSWGTKTLLPAGASFAGVFWICGRKGRHYDGLAVKPLQPAVANARHSHMRYTSVLPDFKKPGEMGPQIWQSHCISRKKQPVDPDLSFPVVQGRKRNHGFVQGDPPGTDQFISAAEAGGGELLACIHPDSLLWKHSFVENDMQIWYDASYSGAR